MLSLATRLQYWSTLGAMVITPPPPHPPQEAPTLNQHVSHQWSGFPCLI